MSGAITPAHIHARNLQSATPFSTPSSRSSVPVLPPPTPLPLHPSDQYPPGKILSTAATAFALKAYLETLLHGIGWDPSTTTVTDFINQYSWLLAEELNTTPDRAAAIFLEIFDKTTPDLRAVCHALVGMEEKLHCSRETSKALRFLFRKNHETTPEKMLEIGGENLDEKVGTSTLKERRRDLSGSVAIWRRIFGGLFREVFGNKKKSREWEK